MELSGIPKEAAIGVASGLGGMFVTMLTQYVQSRRGLLTYFVTHNRVGLSTDDIVFGSVRVTWNGNPVANLYSSTIELTNRSAHDFENIKVRAFTNDSDLLTEKTEIVDTSHFLVWTPEYAKQMHVEKGSEATPAQIALVRSSREYLVPVLNRGQSIRIHFLNAAKSQEMPTIFLDILHKGIRVEYRNPEELVLGVGRGQAALAGTALGFVVVGFLISCPPPLWLAVLIAFAYGLTAQAPGAVMVKSLRWISRLIMD